MLVFIERCRTDRAALVVLLIPVLNRIDQTARYTHRVANFLESHGVAAIDLAPLLAGKDPSDLIAGPDDAHADERLHVLFADLIEERIRDRLLAAPPESSDLLPVAEDSDLVWLDSGTMELLGTEDGGTHRVYQGSLRDIARGPGVEGDFMLKPVDDVVVGAEGDPPPGEGYFYVIVTDEEDDEGEDAGSEL